jgi:hypothetical protein
MTTNEHYSIPTGPDITHENANVNRILSEKAGKVRKVARMLIVIKKKIALIALKIRLHC